MAFPRIRDAFTLITTLPAATSLAVCLFLPQTADCHGRPHTAIENGSWLIIAPVILFGTLPALWRMLPREVRHALPENMLMFTIVVMATGVLTIPVAIYLMWGYAKKQFRGETLVAMCTAGCTMVFLVVFPFATMFDEWLPAAGVTWGSAIVELVGLIVWASAAAARSPEEADTCDASRPFHAHST